MRNAIMIIAAMLAHLIGFFGVGRPMAQRCFPGMSAVEIKANMADGFYTGKSRDCGYSFGVFYSVFKGGANTWSFGGEYLQTYKPYAEKVVSPLRSSRRRRDTISTLSATIRRHSTSMAACRLSVATKR